MKRLLLPFVLAGVLTAAFAAPAAAQPTCNVQGKGGAAALVSLVQANIGNVGVNVCDVEVEILNNSLNNLLQNADVHVIENILNNSPFLNDITVNVVGNNIVISVLGAPILAIAGT